ncbi:serine/threonine-protein kinase [Methylobacterium frigidaeris]|uniref:Serine/threonine-protein kinase PknD n=1 Tax=Methylobacterium frigidaeris TaxID=2038277 RepID=A0AA37HGJ0_9HYPH|nr:serine/threonine-protein kinase [Methylobacterium frigidaeris]GJD65387.1 Serine/threonine-protein kinase PknD [Methylobacterium frigidaeris]
MSESTKLIGQMIAERYEVKSFINEGGMQEVYLAEDQLLRRFVALKVPKNKHALKRFRRSAVVSARVNHSNVAKTLGYIEAHDRSFFIEEHIEGKDLGFLLKHNFRSFDPLWVCKIVHRLAKGIAASHHVGVVHRDLKPSNIMSVDGPFVSEIKITDFGIAKMVEDELGEAIEGGDESLTASQTAIGALPYMAPELIHDIKNADKPADIWSLGALTYELVTGAKPFGTGLKAVPAILAAKVPSYSQPQSRKTQFSSAFKDIMNIVHSCIVASPSARPSADEVVSMCESLCYPIETREFGRISKFDNPS